MEMIETRLSQTCGNAGKIFLGASTHEMEGVRIDERDHSASE
jgi:hypothetical protein